jgi:hypothetical protein
MGKKINRENHFDLDFGYLTKSPCRECPQKSALPKCSEKCEMLTQLQKLLAGVVSCSNSISELEEYSLSRPDGCGGMLDTVQYCASKFRILGERLSDERID